MEILGFVLSVWGAISIGVFFIAMVIGCSFDRRNEEGIKWWIFLIGIVLFAWWQWDNLSWRSFLQRDLWVFVGMYLAAGLVYSMLEFFLEVRRSARRWSTAWADHKKWYANHIMGEWEKNKRDTALRNTKARERSSVIAADQEPMPPEPVLDESKMADAFMDTRRRYGEESLIGVTLVNKPEPGENLIEPKVNRVMLARCIGAWTIFWPFYAISLILGDLLEEVFRAIANFVAYISGRFVRLSFKNVFK